jgi:chemotaxis-related protein WspB
MLFLLFQLGDARYALDAGLIAEVLPCIAVTSIPQAPSEVAGVHNYRGAPVPAIDLNQLMLGRPAQRRLSTRLVLVHVPGRNGGSRLLGLIAEKATGTFRRERTDFMASGISNDRAPYLGPVAADAGGLVQWVDVTKLLPSSVLDALFTDG